MSELILFVVATLVGLAVGAFYLSIIESILLGHPTLLLVLCVATIVAVVSTLVAVQLVRVRQWEAVRRSAASRFDPSIFSESETLRDDLESGAKR